MHIFRETVNRDKHFQWGWIQLPQNMASPPQIHDPALRRDHYGNSHAQETAIGIRALSIAGFPKQTPKFVAQVN